MPFHFAGWFEGVDQRSKYPKGADPIVLGESVNTIAAVSDHDRIRHLALRSPDDTRRLVGWQLGLGLPLSRLR
jgi:hypothetical protein